MSGGRANAWMPLYVGDYLRDTSRLSTEQHGAYLLLIMDYWANGAPPDDDKALAAITRMSAAAWRRTRPALQGFFQVEAGKWNHKRVERERMKAFAITETRRAAGTEGAGKRWGKHMANATTPPSANGSQTGRQADAPLQSHPHSQTLSSSELVAAREGARHMGEARPRGETRPLSSLTSELIRASLRKAAQ